MTGGEPKRGGLSTEDPGAVELGLDCRVSFGHVLGGAACWIQLALTDSRPPRFDHAYDRLNEAETLHLNKKLNPCLVALPFLGLRSYQVRVFLTRILMMPNVATAQELRRKAEECRTDAQQFIVPETKAQMLATAAEYERLAMRAAEFEQRSQVGANNDRALTNWRD